MSMSNPDGSKDSTRKATPNEEIRLNPSITETMPDDFVTWDELKYSSVDVAITDSESLEYRQFASNECLYFARIHCNRHYDGEPLESSSSSSSPLSSSSDNPWAVGFQSIGLVYLIPTRFTGELSVGIALAPGQRGAGRARMAMNKLLKWVFEEAGYHRVQAAIMDGPHRLAAMNLFTNVGFSHEGIRRRQVYSNRSQQWVDVTYMAIVDTEWALHIVRPMLPKTRWDGLFERQQQEREELLELDSKHLTRTPKKTGSMDTIKIGDLDTKLFDFELEMEEEYKGFNLDTEKYVENVIQSTQNYDSESGHSLGGFASLNISGLSERGEGSSRDTMENRRAVNSNEHEGDTSDFGMEENRSHPPDSDYPGSNSSFDSDFDDAMSNWSWDRCSGVESV